MPPLETKPDLRRELMSWDFKAELPGSSKILKDNSVKTHTTCFISTAAQLILAQKDMSPQTRLLIRVPGVRKWKAKTTNVSEGGSRGCKKHSFEA